MRAESKPATKPDVVITLTHDEAVRLRDSIGCDFIWSETSEEALYEELHNALGVIV